MLADNDAIATVAVKDLETARKFYANTLGLKEVANEGGEAIVFKSGKSTLNVYRSRYAGTNQATAMTWAVDDVDGTVRELKAKGIKLERYDMPDVKMEGDVHVFGETRAAWFKDPDGNILAVVNNQ